MITNAKETGMDIHKEIKYINITLINIERLKSQTLDLNSIALNKNHINT